MVKIQHSLFLFLGSALLAQGQSLYTATLTYPSETITWFVQTEWVTDTISAHTQLATVDAITYSETVSGGTFTEDDGRNVIVRTIPPETYTRSIPSTVLAASLQLTSISRTLFSSQFTSSFASEVITAVLTEGIPGDLYTITGPTIGGVAIGTVVEQLSSRSVINTIPGPTVTHPVGQGQEIIVTENGSPTTRFDSTSTFIETFSSTLVTRHIGTSSIFHLITITPSDSGSVSGISSSTGLPSPPPTVTFTQNVTASTTVGSTVIQTSVVLSTLGSGQPTSRPTQSAGGNTKCPKPTNSMSKKWSTTNSMTKSKCATKPKPTKCHPKKKSGNWSNDY
ncbi:hypothetical protein K7432_004857 [Basidiobolus ranarum]|uniref:Uncharacterized protein n=1 Tax=Basidiobolus ranarum TaxID=34480 RepID=A0ABR2W412_9FUNG